MFTADDAFFACPGPIQEAWPELADAGRALASLGYSRVPGESDVDGPVAAEHRRCRRNVDFFLDNLARDPE